MSGITRNKLVFASVLFALCNLSAGAEKQETSAGQNVENPYKGARVLVEALLVEVKLDAMEKAGVGLLSKERPTAEKILSILKDKNTGKIQTSEKLAIVSPGQGRMETSGRTMVPLSKDPNSAVKSWQQYDIGSAISANLEISPDGRIWLSFKMDLKIIGNESRADNQPPDVLNYSWDSSVTLKSEIPIIAAALEGKDKMTYMIIRADIEQDSLSSQQKK